jgi:hypothetical protein
MRTSIPLCSPGSRAIPERGQPDQHRAGSIRGTHVDGSRAFASVLYIKSHATSFQANVPVNCWVELVAVKERVISASDGDEAEVFVEHQLLDEALHGSPLREKAAAESHKPTGRKEHSQPPR